MRIVSGRFRGRRIDPPLKGWPTRPTTDFAREALFNVLQHQVDWPSTVMLDLFGGTGMISLEAVSRGCQHVTYVDQHSGCFRWMKAIAHELEVTDHLTLIRQDINRYLRNASTSGSIFDLIFADPPYDWLGMATLPEQVLSSPLLADGGTLIIEHSKQTDLSDHHRWQRDKKYGATVFSFFC